MELDLNGNGDIEREQRRQPRGESYGLTASEVQDYLDAARQQGMAHIEELKIKRNGDIEVEGNDDNGRELEVDFRTGSLDPVKVERDN